MGKAQQILVTVKQSAFFPLVSQNGINPKTYYYRLRRVREECVEAAPAVVPLKLEIAETAIHTFQGHMNEYTIKHEPSLACTKCNNSFQSEPYQYEKTNVFLQFLMSIKLKYAEIEYKDMIRYLDKVLKIKKVMKISQRSARKI